MKVIKNVIALALIALLCAPLQAVAQPEDGCTHSQGYWKTHSEYGPATYDDTWAFLPLGADTSFFLSGQTWLQVWKTPPHGNAYYILAYNFEAAILNILAGASGPLEVTDALVQAVGLYNTYTPAQVASTSSVRKAFLSINSILESYNVGEIGPGACVECPCFDGIEDGEPYAATAISSIAPCSEPYEGNFQTDGSYDFLFEWAESPFAVSIDRFESCDGTVVASCSGGPAGYFDLSEEQYSVCIAGPGWPSGAPD